MNSLTFRWQHRYSTSKTGIEVPITISINANQSTSLLAKLDTGATFCIFQREHAEGIGLDVEKGLLEEVSTVTGTFRAYGHMVSLMCFEYEFETMVYFAAQHNFPRNVLGLRGWFDKLRLVLSITTRLSI